MADSNEKLNSESTELTVSKEGQVLVDEKLFQEINLLRIKGYLFKFATRRSNRRPHTLAITEKSVKLPTGETLYDQPLLFETNPLYGWPEELAYKILQACLKKLSEEGYENAESVVLGFREIGRIIGRKQGPNSFGKKDSDNFKRAIKQLSYTGIECTIYNKENEQALAYNFKIFANALFLTEKGKIRTCAIRLDEEIRRNLNVRYTFCINYSRLLRFRGSGMMLYEQLFFAMGKLYSQQKTKNFVFTKDYKDVCTSWLGGLTVHDSQWRIEQQLAEHFNDLKREKIIRAHKIESAKSGGFNIRFFPGAGFFEDYNRFYLKVHQLPLPFQATKDHNLIERPLALLYYFHQKRLGVTDLEDTDFPAKDIEFSQELSAKYTDEVCREFVNFSLSKAKDSGFNVQTLNGIRQYLNDFLATQSLRERRKEQELKRIQEEKLERLKSEYNLKRRTHLMRIREAMNAEELAEFERPIIEAVRTKFPSTNLGISTLVLLQGDELLAERFRVPTFEQWLADPSTLL